MKCRDSSSPFDDRLTFFTRLFSLFRARRLFRFELLILVSIFFDSFASSKCASELAHIEKYKLSPRLGEAVMRVLAEWRRREPLDERLARGYSECVCSRLHTRSHSSSVCVCVRVCIFVCVCVCEGAL